jgi:hypothetical protein
VVGGVRSPRYIAISIYSRFFFFLLIFWIFVITLAATFPGWLVLIEIVLRHLGETLIQLEKGNETMASFAFPATSDAACASTGQSSGRRVGLG